jgi:hypothetical protein
MTMNDSIPGLTTLVMKWLLLQAIAVMMCCTQIGVADDDTWSTPKATPEGEIVLQVAAAEGEDPYSAGVEAAKALQEKMGNVPPQAVILSECFEDREYKEKLLRGICSVLPSDIVLGGSTYGSFHQAGCSDCDSVCLLGIGGEGVSVAASLVRDMGTSMLTYDNDITELIQRFHTAGAKLANKLRKTDDDRLLIIIPDAHSPKNQLLVEGAQQVLGNEFPITGGSANKNAGQTFVVFRGKLHQDSAVALMLSGDFNVSLSGRKAQDNDQVIRTAHDGAAAALADFKGKPVAALAFNCAGRRGKLDRVEDELAAIQQALGKELTLFGCYCAGEIGPVDSSEKKPDTLSGGVGWHVMFTIIGR